MCYSVSYLTHKNEVYARRLGIPEETQSSFFSQLDRIRDFIGVAWYKNGFEFPSLPAILLNPDINILPAFWGLIPHWAKSQEKQKNIIKHTLNARIESLLEKPSFKSASLKNRNVILLDGFFEYKHVNNKAIPYFIKHSDNMPMLIAGIFEKAPENIPFPVTVSIVTRPANAFMSAIHNKSRSGEPRMPLILNEEYMLKWITLPVTNAIQECLTFEVKDLSAIPVGPLTGKNGIGNRPEAQMEIGYYQSGS